MTVAEVYTGYTLTGPAAGSTVSVGQTITITWEAHGHVNSSTLVEVSHNEGESWTLLTGQGGVSPTDPQWAAWPWTIPATLAQSGGVTVSLADATLLLRVRGYFLQHVMDEIDVPLTVSSASIADVSPRASALDGTTPTVRYLLNGIRAPAAFGPAPTSAFLPTLLENERGGWRIMLGR